MKEKILVPIDGSDFSINALQYAIKLAQASEAEIILLNVQLSYNTPNIKRFVGQNQIKEYQEQLAQEAINAALKVTNEYPELHVTTKMLIGSPELKICEEARNCSVTNIVMGSRGLGAVKRALLGSVSYGVLHESHCPVTIVP